MYLFTKTKLPLLCVVAWVHELVSINARRLKSVGTLKGQKSWMNGGDPAAAWHTHCFCFPTLCRNKFVEFDMKPVCKKCYEKFPLELKKRLKKLAESLARNWSSSGQSSGWAPAVYDGKHFRWSSADLTICRSWGRTFQQFKHFRMSLSFWWRVCPKTSITPFVILSFLNILVYI